MTKRTPYRVRRKKRPLKNPRFVGLLLILFGGAAFVYVLFFSPVGRIQEVRVEGADRVAKEGIVSLVSGEAGSKSILLLDPASLEDLLLSEFPELRQAVVARALPPALVVRVVERSQTVVWCGETCFALDASGTAFREAEPEPPVFRGGTPDTSLGDRALDPALIASLLAFQDDAALAVREFDAVSSSRVNVLFEEGWEAYLNPEENMEWQAIKLLLVLNQEVPANLRGELSYIDLRFGDQAYIKYAE